MGPPKSVPGQLNYQGHLADAVDSSAITAALEMTFRLFDSETKGAELWSETHTMVEVSEGLFQVLLGSVTSFPANLFDGSSLWLQTEVGTEILVPRKALASAAYSQMAETADHAATADWATDAQNAIHADTADHCPGGEAWTISGDDVYRETGKVGIGTTTPLTELDVTGSVNATAYYGDGSNLTGVSGSADADWTIDGNDVYHETGKVGIGTTTPLTELDVTGSVNATTYYGDGSNLTGTADNDWIISAPDIYSALAGKVGIGVTHPTTKLEVDGEVKATTYYGDGSNLTGISGTTDNDWTIDGDNIYHETGKVGIGTTSPSGELQVVGSARIGVGAAWLDISNDGWLFDANAAVTVNDQLRVLSSAESYFNGSLGIGTTSPSEKLDVHGTIKAVAAEGPQFIIHDSNGSNDRPGIQFTNNNIQYIGGDDDDDEYFEIYSQYGQTRSYDAHLRVHGKATSDWGKHIDLTHDGTDAIISTDAGDIVLDPAANVGIGTNSPSQVLHVAGHGLIEGPDGFDMVGEQATLFLGDTGKYLRTTYGGTVTLYSNDPILLRTFADANQLYLTTGGRVGIGTTSPSEKLEVAGSVEVNNDLIVTGAYKGSIGPNNGAPFPRPAYDSGWQSISAGVPLIFNHSIGGDTDDYVVEISVNNGTSNEHLHTGAVYWSGLNGTSATAHRKVGDTTVSNVRMRIWVYN